MMTDYAGLLRLLAQSAIEFIVVGGVAAKAQGSLFEELDRLTET